jgi:hypothetical protein
MKIAICYSGNFRTFNDCIENHFKIFSKLSNSIDVYFSTWSSLKYSEGLNDSSHFFSEKRLDTNTEITEELIEKYIPDRWNLVKCKIDNYSDFEDFSNLECQYFKIKDCFYLIDPSSGYDVIIRMRTDVKLNNFMDSDLFFEEITKNNIIFNNYTWYEYQFCNRDINEMFWFSNYEFSKKTVRILDNFNFLKDKLIGNDFYGEKICYENLILEGIENKILLFNFNYNVIR